jgi:hypothetical protein
VTTDTNQMDVYTFDRSTWMKIDEKNEHKEFM